jgi:hypothetical protein
VLVGRALPSEAIREARTRCSRAHWDGILNCNKNWTTSAAIESLLSKLRLAGSRERGFRNCDYLRAIEPARSHHLQALGSTQNSDAAGFVVGHGFTAFDGESGA